MLKKNDYERGDHLVSRRMFYQHHGIYYGRNQVIHYTGLSSNLIAGKVCITSLEDFCDGDLNNIRVIEHLKPKFNRDEAIKRAESRLNEDNYHLIFNNCEHFVNDCIEGESTSKQVKTAFSVILISMGVGIAHLLKHRNREKNNV